MSKTVERKAIVPYTTEQMYDLVNDIEAYPQFMSGCAGAKILERGEGWLIARLELEKAGFKQSFTTRNTLKRPQSMTLELVDGPFKTFSGVWKFTPAGESSCEVSFRLTYSFSNFLLGIAASHAMEQMAGEQVAAICERAKSQYQS